MSLKERQTGIGVLLTEVSAKVQFKIVCAKCGQPVVIAAIIHFAECPQVSVEPCSCQIQVAALNNAKRMGLITDADMIMKEMADDVKRSST